MLCKMFVKVDQKERRSENKILMLDGKGENILTFMASLGQVDL